MGRLWCAACPTVDVPKASAPKHVTIVLPFYENHQFLERQIAEWSGWSSAVRDSVTVIVADDGSPVPAVLPQRLPFDVRLFRIEQDVRWNWLAARNIGAHHAADGWLLMTDMDHVVPEATMAAVIAGEHDPQAVYAFARQEHTGETVNPHSASFLMTRAMFWRIGGYDEALSGHYGTDGEYRRRVAHVAPIHILRDPLVRWEYVSDSSTRRYARKQPQDAATRAIIARRGSNWRPKVLSFPYHEVMA